MAQISVPVAEVVNQGWIGFFGTTIEGDPPNTVSAPDPIWSAIQTQTDNDQITSPHEPPASVYATKLDDIVDPEDLEDDWVVKFRAGKPTGTVVQLNLTIQLRQFYVDETEPGELLAEMYVEDIPDTLTDYEIVVPDTTVIVFNPSDLYIRAVADV